MSDKAQDQLTQLETNLNQILEHAREGLAAGNFGDRAEEIKRHATAAKQAFDWLDNFTVIKEQKRIRTDVIENLFAALYDTDNFPSSEEAKEILAEEGIDTTELKAWASEKLREVKNRVLTATTRQWMDWFEVTDMREIAASPKFKELIAHQDFKTARGWMTHGNMFLVLGDESWWGWETPGSHCMVVGTLFPIAPKQTEDADTEPDEPETVSCKFCHEETPANTAHRHAGGWVGDDCCWEERLRSSE